MFDIIVIGAGPTGCTVSKILSENGLKVLLVEKFALPRYKSCSGQLIKKSIDLVKLYFGDNVPLSTMCTPFENKGMIFVDDKGKEYRFEQKGLNVWRSQFDNWLSAKAAQYGVLIKDKTSAISCSEGNNFVTVTLKDEKIHSEMARYVVDCEGIVGLIKRKINRDTPQYISTYQTYNQGSIDLDYHYFYAYLQPELSGYDAWFNVKDDYLIFGVSGEDLNELDHYYGKFIDYMIDNHHLKIERQLKIDKWLMPRIIPGCPIDYGVGRIFFAGEIAGFLNPMGEGISAGMESGYHIANAIIQNFDNLDLIYESYKEKTLPLRNYMIRQWNFLGNISHKFKYMKL